MKDVFLQQLQTVSRFMLLGAVFFFWADNLTGQEVVDKTVATITDGVKTELITLSDLRWQLALEPGTQLAPAGSDDLNRVLQQLIDLRIFALEAERIPRASPTKIEIDKEIRRVLDLFPSTAAFESRLRMVGFDSVRDDNFERLMTQRVAIEKYLDFRFRSFIVNTSDDEAKYYRDTFVPDYKKRYPGVEAPTLAASRAEINRMLTENKVETNIEAFLDEAKRRVEVVILSEV